MSNTKKTNRATIIVGLIFASPFIGTFLVFAFAGIAFIYDAGGGGAVVTLGLGLVSTIALFKMYNLYKTVIVSKNEAEHALESINIQLRARLDTIPNLFKTANHYLEKEKEILTEITKIREHTTPSSITEKDSIRQSIDDAKKVDLGVAQIKARLEQYPELRSVELFQNSMKSLERIEGDIAASRRLYNMTAKDMNILFDTFPSSFIVSLLKYPRLDYYSDPDISAISKPIDVSEYNR